MTLAITRPLNLAKDLDGSIANESTKGLACKPLFRECNSMTGLRSYICIAIVLNQSRFSFNGSCGPCRIAFRESKVLL